MRVTVLLGGASDERDVSLATGVQVARALREAGHGVVAFDTARGPLTPEEETVLLEKGVDAHPPAPDPRDRLVEEGMDFLARHPDAAAAQVHFIALHGGAGEDGTLQGQLDRAGVRYTGSDADGCRVAMDKDRTKAILTDRGIPTAPWLTDCFDADEVERALGLPVVVKAAHGGSSLRLELAHDRPELEAALIRARDFQDAVVVERYVKGRGPGDLSGGPGPLEGGGDAGPRPPGPPRVGVAGLLPGRLHDGRGRSPLVPGGQHPSGAHGHEPGPEGGGGGGNPVPRAVPPTGGGGGEAGKLRRRAHGPGAAARNLFALAGV